MHIISIRYIFQKYNRIVVVITKHKLRVECYFLRLVFAIDKCSIAKFNIKHLNLVVIFVELFEEYNYYPIKKILTSE